MGEAVEKGRLLGQFLRILRPRVLAPSEALAQADALRESGDLEQAETRCALALREFPTYASAHAVMGDIQRDKGALDAAEASWITAQRLHPEHPRANLRLAHLYLSRGEFSLAMRALECAFFSNPTSPETAHLLHQTQERQGGEAADTARWLSRVVYVELLQVIHACSSVETAALLTMEGKFIHDGTEASREITTGGETIKMLLLDSRPLLERLGAGSLRMMYFTGAERRFLWSEVSGHGLLTVLAPEAILTEARREIREAITSVRRAWQERGME